MAASVPANAARSAIARSSGYLVCPMQFHMRNTTILTILRQNDSLHVLPFRCQQQMVTSNHGLSPSALSTIPSQRGRLSVVACRAACGTSLKDPEKQESDVTKMEAGEGIDQIDTWTIKMLYDGGCPLCMREVNMLQERNKMYGTIKFVDISADDYSTEENAGIGFETAMGRIHAILRDGTILLDIAAFRRLYEEVGLGWVYAITKYKPIATIADALYFIWAKYRLPITGRPPLLELLEERRRRKSGANCLPDGQCRLD